MYAPCTLLVLSWCHFLICRQTANFLFVGALALYLNLIHSWWVLCTRNFAHLFFLVFTARLISGMRHGGWWLLLTALRWTSSSASLITPPQMTRHPFSTVGPSCSDNQASDALVLPISSNSIKTPDRGCSWLRVRLGEKKSNYNTVLFAGGTMLVSFFYPQWSLNPLRMALPTLWPVSCRVGPCKSIQHRTVPPGVPPEKFPFS